MYFKRKRQMAYNIYIYHKNYKNQKFNKYIIKQCP